MDYRTICILGGSGFVGRHLTARLVDAGYHVRVPSRDPSRHRNLKVLPTVEVVRADVHDPDALAREFDGVDAVINLIGIINEKGRDGSGFQHAHVDLARKVLDGCRQQGVHRLLHMSALGAGADAPSHYLRTKGQAESLLPMAQDGDPATTVFAPSLIFGPDDTLINRFAGLLRFAPVLPLACARARQAPVYVGDVADAFVRCLTDRNTIGRRYALYGPEVYTLEELVQFTADLMGKRRMVIALPDWASNLQAHILEFAPGKPFSIDNYRSFLTGEIEAESGLAALGIEPRSLNAEAPSFFGGDYVSNRSASGRAGRESRSD